MAEDVAAATNALAESFGAEERRQKSADWKNWVHQAVQGGGGAAHRYAKPLEAIRIAAVADPDGVPSACPAALLQADHATWMKAWGASSESPRCRCAGNPGAGAPADSGDLAVQRGGRRYENPLHRGVVEQREVARVVRDITELGLRRPAHRFDWIGNGRDARAGHEPGEIAGVEPSGTA